MTENSENKEAETIETAQAPARKKRGPKAKKALRATVHEQPRATLRADEWETRSRKMTANQSKFHIDASKIPAGHSYEWKAVFILNEPNPSYEIELHNQGWTPVPRTRHPDMMPPGWKGNTIERGGQRLYERPMRLTNEARLEDTARARGAVRARLEQIGHTPPGSMTRNHPGLRQQIDVKSEVTEEFIPKE